ncbi:MAG: DUF502 domain-containing protein [Clostridia bacterium]|nr:DUF502 domain-containing protein [Clostridia bacterium]
MKNLMNQLKNRFLLGLVILMPMGLSLWIIVKIFNAVDAILGNSIYEILGKRIPGLGILIMLATIILAGYLGNQFAFKKVTNFIQQMFLKVPIVKTIYGPLKDIFTNFSDEESNNFKKAVLVTYPKEGSQCIGFVTKDSVLIGDQEKSVVFIPTTPNPTSGILVYVDHSQYQELDLPVDDALKAIVSLGAISPNKIEDYK